VRVLIVEDEVKTAEAIAAMLRSRGDAVDLVGDGNDALEWAGSHQYDVIVLDLDLPECDGFGVSSALRVRGSSRVSARRLVTMSGFDQGGTESSLQSSCR
jgi:DNA-binding response OmpR family regulator